MTHRTISQQKCRCDRPQFWFFGSLLSLLLAESLISVQCVKTGEATGFLNAPNRMQPSKGTELQNLIGRHLQEEQSGNSTSSSPSQSPTTTPTSIPTQFPSLPPTTTPTNSPSLGPTSSPTKLPSISPTNGPTGSPSAVPSISPSASPTEEQSAIPSEVPSVVPSEPPSGVPSLEPSGEPSLLQSDTPSQTPSTNPSNIPSDAPTAIHSDFPTATASPSRAPSLEPSEQPTLLPSNTPSALPSEAPSDSPSGSPSLANSNLPTVIESGAPSESRILESSNAPSSNATTTPSEYPSEEPTQSPSWNSTDLGTENQADDSQSVNETETDGFLPFNDEDMNWQNDTIDEVEDIELGNETVAADGEQSDSEVPETNNATDVDYEHENILALRWKLHQESVSYDGLRFDVHYAVSDFIESDLVLFDLYDGPRCSGSANRITDQHYFNAWIADDGTPKGPGIESKQLTLSTQIIPDNITKSEAYQEVGEDVIVEFCIRLSLHSKALSDPTSTEINKYEAAIKLVVDLKDEFSIQSQVVEAMDEGRETAGDEFFVEAFVCDDEGRQILDSKTYVQGQAVRVCVQPTQQALDIGFRMRSIDRFTFWQGYVSQEAIVGGDVSINGLTESDCEAGGEQCSFSTLLSAYFFQGPSTVEGDGFASLQFYGSRRNRRLRSSVPIELADAPPSRRRLQDRAKSVKLQKFQIHQPTRQTLNTSPATANFTMRSALWCCLVGFLGVGLQLL